MDDLLLPRDLSVHYLPHTPKPAISANSPSPVIAPRGIFIRPKSVQFSHTNPSISIHLSKPKPPTERLSEKIPEETSVGLNTDSDFELRNKLVYLESLGVDSYKAVAENPSIASTSIQAIETVVKFLCSMGMLRSDLGRVFGMCPEALTASIPRQLRPVFTFLLREVNVPTAHIRKVIFRRPRLLACSVKEQLRPTLYFLLRLGFREVSRNPSLLSCSVQNKFIPRLEYFQALGLSYDDAVSMVLRCPALLSYSVNGNFQPKFDYLIKDMGRIVDDLKAFPQYFAFSLEKRIKPRHMFLVENGVQLPLSIMLRASDGDFYDRLEELQNGSLKLDDQSERWCFDMQIKGQGLINSTSDFGIFAG